MVSMNKTSFHTCQLFYLNIHIFKKKKKFSFKFEPKELIWFLLTCISAFQLYVYRKKNLDDGPAGLTLA